MADEEKAEYYANKNVPTDAFGYRSLGGVHYFGYRSLDDVYYDVKQAYLDGLVEGRKEVSYMNAEEYDKYLDVCREAKEIIKDLLKCLPNENVEGIYEVTVSAEEFLRRIEK